MSEWGWVGTAYGLTWAVIVGYTLYLGVRSRRARARFERSVMETERGQ